jgi:hypothetical protein
VLPQGISVYGACGASVIARWMSQRNGTSAWHTSTASARSAAAASARAPPWLPPLTAIGASGLPASSRAVSTARAASTNIRV